MILKKNKKIRGQKGFSFLEVIISLFVLSVGFLGVITLATSTLRNSFMQRDSVIASALVQEGIEIVYNIRDTSLAKGKDAFTNIPAATASYRVDYSSPALVPVNCADTSDCKFYLNASNFYTHAPGMNSSPTKFSRKIIIEDTSDIPSGVIARKVTSVVAWGAEGFPSSSVVTTSNCNKSTHCSFTQTELQENN